MEKAKYVICGKEKLENVTKYGVLYYCKGKTDAWKLKRKINKVKDCEAYIRPIKSLKFVNQLAV
jgi:hypothetical protein